MLRTPLSSTATPSRGRPAPTGRRLAQEDRPVAVGDLEPRVERRRDVDEGLQQLEALVAREEPLAPEVLDGAQPVDVGGERLEAREQALHVLAGPEVEHLLLGAERPDLPVDPRLAQGTSGDERASSEEREPRASLEVPGAERGEAERRARRRSQAAP